MLKRKFLKSIGLRCVSIVGLFSCTIYLGYLILQKKESLSLLLWLLFGLFSIVCNQVLVILFLKLNEFRVIFMIFSFLLVAISTVSCVIGSLYYFCIKPIHFDDHRLLAFILIFQVSCIHSTLSSAEFIIKQRDPVTMINLIDSE